MSSNKRNVRFALLGAAAVGPYHADALRDVDGAELVAIVDLNEQALRELGRRHPGARLFPSQEALHASGLSVDVEIVAVPTRLHLDVARAAMAQRHDVMVEKPLAGNARDAAALVAEAREKGRKLYNIAQRALMLPEVPRLIADGVLGTISTVRLDWLRTADEPPFVNRDPRGAFADIGIHHLSLLQALFGRAATGKVGVSGRAFREGSKGEFLAGATLDFATFRADVQVGWKQHLIVPARGLEERCTIAIHGTGGGLVGVLPTSEEVVAPYNAMRMTRVQPNGPVSVGTPVRTVGECRRMEHRAMVAWVREGTVPRLVDPVAQVRLVDAFYASAERGGERLVVTI